MLDEAGTTFIRAEEGTCPKEKAASNEAASHLMSDLDA
jgi:hypothetical protein